MGDDIEYNKFIESIPSLFGSAIQKASMSSFLWNNQDPKTIIYNMRLYDIIRRLYYVHKGEEPSDDKVMELMKNVKQNKQMMDFFIVYIQSGTFPSNDVISMIHDR